MRFLKVALVALCLFLGAPLAYQGLGTHFRILSLESLDHHLTPVGIAFILFGMLIARFWTVSE
jgi:hypothetical protein